MVEGLITIEGEEETEIGGVEVEIVVEEREVGVVVGVGVGAVVEVEVEVAEAEAKARIKEKREVAVIVKAKVRAKAKVKVKVKAKVKARVNVNVKVQVRVTVRINVRVAGRRVEVDLGRGRVGVGATGIAQIDHEDMTATKNEEVEVHEEAAGTEKIRTEIFVTELIGPKHTHMVMILAASTNLSGGTHTDIHTGTPRIRTEVHTMTPSKKCLRLVPRSVVGVLKCLTWGCLDCSNN